MLTGTIQIVCSCGGVSVQSTVTRQASGAIPPQSHDLDAGNAGTLTTRTSDTAGTITAESAGHDIQTGDAVDLGWLDANGAWKCRYNCDVGTVSGTSIPITSVSGGGEVLPAQDTELYVDKREPLDVDFDGDKALIICAALGQNGCLVFEDSGDAVLDGHYLVANEAYLFYSASNIANPLTGNPVDEIYVSNLGPQAATFKLGGLYESDT
jgi:hypothetical protein